MSIPKYDKNILKSGKEIIVQHEFFDSYNNLFESDERKPKHDIAQFLSLMNLLRLTEEQSAKCEISISENKFICTLRNAKKYIIW